MRMTEQEVMDYAAENDVKFIRLAFVDLYGTLKNMAITPSELPRPSPADSALTRRR